MQHMRLEKGLMRTPHLLSLKHGAIAKHVPPMISCSPDHRFGDCAKCAGKASAPSENASVMVLGPLAGCRSTRGSLPLSTHEMPISRKRCPGHKSALLGSRAAQGLLLALVWRAETTSARLASNLGNFALLIPFLELLASTDALTRFWLRLRGCFLR